MKVILGIDVGGSTTKIVGYTKEGTCLGMMQAEATDQITSAYGAFGKFMAVYGLRLGDVSQIFITGVGANYVESSMYDIPTQRVDEFIAIGTGGLVLADRKEALIVSMGTGTALIRATENNIVHLGGSGVGGGTLLNLCSRFAGANNFDSIIQLASQGDIARVDLTLADISREAIGNMPPNTTASNFGNLQDTATNADIVLGIINMIFESIGMMAVFATLNDHISDVVLIGSLTTIPQARTVYNAFQQLCPVRFHIPENAIYATAVGAALSQLY